VSASTITTTKGASCRVLEAGSGEPLVFLHGAGGLYDDNPFLDQLAETYRVLAPELPGYGESQGEELLEDMLDFTLHGLDVLDALGLESANVVGHSMGGMIAAEMACVSPRSVRKLALVNPAGLWLDEHPIPDLFSMLPFELGAALFHDAEKGAATLTGGVDWNDRSALQEFFIGNARRLGTAGKILFPIPNRRLSKRLYRLKAPTLVVWGTSDKLIDPAYAEAWKERVPQAQVRYIEAAGHMTPYEQPEALVSELTAFFG
jgi:pimeloyl-ACP methyl ester carboxylesterase